MTNDNQPLAEKKRSQNSGRRRDKKASKGAEARQNFIPGRILENDVWRKLFIRCDILHRRRASLFYHGIKVNYDP
jgi:hypothetical protein